MRCFGSATWSGGSFWGRESRVERKVFAKESSVMVPLGRWVGGCVRVKIE